MMKGSYLDVGKIKKELGSMEASHGEMALSKLKMEDDLMAYKRECEELREQVERLREEKKVMCDREARGEERYRKLVDDDLMACRRECEEMREQVERLKEEKKVMCDREGRSEERYRKFVEDTKKQEAVQRDRLKELQGRNNELERGKRADGALVELYKSRFEELGSRVSRLEEDAKVLMAEQPLVSKWAEEAGVGGTRVSFSLSGPHSGRSVRKEQVSEAVNLNNRMVSPMRSSGRHTSGDVVEIIDSDDEPMEDNSSASGVKRKRASPYDWEIESEMLLALEKDPELCMRAVCALYREKCFEEQTVKGLELPNAQSVDKSDALRGTMLAEFLINRDPGAKLRKSILELKRHDPRGLDDSKRLATMNSKKLFDIYRKCGDSSLFIPFCK